MPIKVIITIIPRAEQSDFTWEKLHWLAQQVKAHEPGVSAYRYGRNGGSFGDKGFVVHME